MIPKISVITVTYNVKKSIEETILNVINLKYNNLEYIIIDGGSTDGTVDVIKKYENKLSYWVSEPDNGIYDAMNKGWSKVDDDSFILYLGAGDKIINLPDMNLYSKNDLIYGDVALGEKRIFKSTVGWRSFFGNTIHHQAMLIHKSIHFMPPFSLDFKIYSDFDFNQRLLKRGIRFHKDKDFLAFALEGGVSEQINIEEIQKVVRKNYGFLMSKMAFIYLKLQQLNEYRKNNSSNSSI
ncbi:MAG TPA: glycosyltransferase family 2 protein [Flavobacterium sp.]